MLPLMPDSVFLSIEEAISGQGWVAKWRESKRLRMGLHEVIWGRRTFNENRCSDVSVQRNIELTTASC